MNIRRMAREAYEGRNPGKLWADLSERERTVWIRAVRKTLALMGQPARRR